MPLPLPDLDDRSYEDFLQEAVASIPSLMPTWTDHNPTDPGITLIELFAWLSEMLIYRVNRIPDANTEVFLRILNGPKWSGSGDLTEDLRETIVNLRERYRAVTGDDYEYLVLHRWPVTPLEEALASVLGMDADSRGQVMADTGLDPKTPIRRLEQADIELLSEYLENRAPHGDMEEVEGGHEAISAAALVTAFGPASDVRRARCVPRRNLASPDSRSRDVPAPAHISLIVLPDFEPLRVALWRWLDERRLLTSRHHVVGPAYARIRIEARLLLQKDAMGQVVKKAATDRLLGAFHPLTGGPEGEGWPFGRAVYVSEIYELLDGTPGVDYVSDLRLTAEEPARTEREGDELVGVRLGPHELVGLEERDLEFADDVP